VEDISCTKLGAVEWRRVGIDAVTNLETFQAMKARIPLIDQRGSGQSRLAVISECPLFLVFRVVDSFM
jgi:hypothetical protein